MKWTAKIIFLILFCSIVISLLMIASDYYMANKIFAANIFLWPISFIIVTAIGINIIRKTIDGYLSFFKSIFIAVLIAFLSSTLFAFYWSHDLEGQYIKNLTYSTMMTLPFNTILALIIGLIYGENEK